KRCCAVELRSALSCTALALPADMDRRVERAKISVDQKLRDLRWQPVHVDIEIACQHQLNNIGERDLSGAILKQSRIGTRRLARDEWIRCRTIAAQKFGYPVGAGAERRDAYQQ